MKPDMILIEEGNGTPTRHEQGGHALESESPCREVMTEIEGKTSAFEKTQP